MSSRENDKKNILIIVIAAVVIFAAIIVFLVCYFNGRDNSEDASADLTERQTEIITQSETTTEATTEETTAETEAATVLEPLEVLGSMQSYLDQNSDTVGWIKVDGTSINNVVVQCDNNDYYLEHDFNGNYSQPGTIFADYRCVVSDYSFNQSDNIIIYGHNQADGTMFGTLQKYKVTKQNTSRFDFYLEHPTFTFSTLYEEYTYKIVAIFIAEADTSQTRDGVIFDYHNYILFGANGRTYDMFMDNINERTEIITGVDVQEGDQFMTLSTCSNEFEPSRFVVIGRKVREGEDPAVDTSQAYLNTDAKEPDWDFIYS